MSTCQHATSLRLRWGIAAAPIVLLAGGCAAAGGGADSTAEVDPESEAVANCKAAWKEQYPRGKVSRIETTGDGGYTFLIEAELRRPAGGGSVSCIARGGNGWAPQGESDLYFAPN